MKLAVVTCAYGPRELSDMTARWWRSLRACSGNFSTIIVAQGLAPLPDDVKPEALVLSRENKGFAWGMNRGIQAAFRLDPTLDRVVIVNNDCTFPQREWLEKLHDRVRSYGSVTMPLNTKCNTKAMVEEGPFPTGRLMLYPYGPAVCWSLSSFMIASIMKEFGYPLFDPDFQKGWAEDNYAAAVIRKLTGDSRPFWLEPRSWIKHEGSVTVNHVIQEERSLEWTKQNERLLSKKLASLEARPLEKMDPSFDPSKPIAWLGDLEINTPK